MANGITVKQGSGGTRVEIRARNQAGLLYAVPSEASWVAEPEQLHAHAIAGFFNDLMSLDSPDVRRMMEKWGLSFRPLELEPQEEASAG